MSRKRYERKYEYSTSKVPEIRPGETLDHYYNRLADLANDRLYRLERAHAEGRPGAEDILKYAYNSAMYDIKHMHITGSEKRFAYHIPKTKDGSKENLTDAHRMINSVKRFLEAPSSTMKGIKEVYKKRADTINNMLELKGRSRLTWQDLAKYFESSMADVNDNKLGYTTLRALGAIRRISNDDAKIREAAAGNRKLSDDAIVNQKAQELLRSGAYDVTEMFR